MTKQKPRPKKEKPVFELLNEGMASRLSNLNYPRKPGYFDVFEKKDLGIVQTEERVRQVIDSVAKPRGWARVRREERYSLQTREISGQLVYSTDDTRTGIPLRVFFNKVENPGRFDDQKTLRYIIESDGSVTEIRVERT
jgi:hypothetical protein